MTTALLTADKMGMCVCLACGLVCSAPPKTGEMAHCPRCMAELSARKPASLSRSWAYLIVAAMLYLPANLLPMMRTTTFNGTRDDTIFSGVVKLWQDGSWDLALIVFTASVLVPVVKILVLAYLLLSVQRRWTWAPLERARLYRGIELIGRWSMLDIFVVALLISLLHFHNLIQVNAGSGSVAFAGVAILTMMASKAFDPRLIWDVGDNREQEVEQGQPFSGERAG